MKFWVSNLCLFQVRDFRRRYVGETEEEHADTVSLMRLVKYEHAYMFHYSMRDKTAAARHLVDDVPEVWTRCKFFYDRSG